MRMLKLKDRLFSSLLAYYYRLRKSSAEKKIKLLKEQIAMVCH